MTLRPPSWLAAIAFAATTASAQLPPAQHVAFAPVTGTMLPLDARFVDEQSHTVRLADFFADHPAIVVLGYYGCSNLCGVVLNGLAAGLAQSGLRAGQDFDVIVVSVDPLEYPRLALQRERALLGTADAPGWHFLTSDARAIERLASALRYRYVYDAIEHQYAHAAGITIVNQDGRVRRVLYGAAFSGRELRNALGQDTVVESARASPDHWLLCFAYDPRTGRYTPRVIAILRVAALATLAGLGFVVVRAVRRRASRPQGIE